VRQAHVLCSESPRSKDTGCKLGNKLAAGTEVGGHPEQTWVSEAPLAVGFAY